MTPHASVSTVRHQKEGTVGGAMRKADELRAQRQEVARRLAEAVCPGDLSIASRTQKIGYGQHQHQPEAIINLEGWLRRELALYADRQGMAILSEPEFELDRDERGYGTLTVLALALPWSALRQPERPGEQG